MHIHNADDIRGLADRIAGLVDDHDADLVMSALLTVVAGVCATCADDKREFQSFLAKAAHCLTSGGLDNLTDITH